MWFSLLIVDFTFLLYLIGQFTWSGNCFSCLINLFFYLTYSLVSSFHLQFSSWTLYEVSSPLLYKAIISRIKRSLPVVLSPLLKRWKRLFYFKPFIHFMYQTQFPLCSLFLLILPIHSSERVKTPMGSQLSLSFWVEEVPRPFPLPQGWGPPYILCTDSRGACMGPN